MENLYEINHVGQLKGIEQSWENAKRIFIFEMEAFQN